MPRPLRQAIGDLCYHVLNRGNGGMQVFHKPQDYQAFVGLIGDACERLPLRILAYCLMPNHFHLVLWPYQDGDLSGWMHWLTTSHVRRYHRHYAGTGHVWQGRFKSFPVQSDEHLYRVLRYVERNPLRAGLVARAEEWRWSSLRRCRAAPKPAFLVEGPIPRPAAWIKHVNEGQPQAELVALHCCLQRGRPYGSRPWQARTARRLGLGSSLRPRGRPRERAKK